MGSLWGWSPYGMWGWGPQWSRGSTPPCRPTPGTPALWMGGEGAVGSVGSQGVLEGPYGVYGVLWGWGPYGMWDRLRLVGPLQERQPYGWGSVGSMGSYRVPRGS